jgi:hypothetical protein
MFYLFRPFIGLSLVGAGILTSCVVAQSASSLNKPEAYAILSEALKAFAARDEAHTVSIVRFTHLPNLDLFKSCLQHSDKSANWHSAIKNLQLGNVSTKTIEPKFHVPFRYELSEEMEEIGGNRVTPPGKDHLEFLREEMAKLEKQSKEHFMQVQMSAPGISDDSQVAIVYIAVSWSGAFEVLRRKDNAWIADPKPLCFWIS